MDIYEYLKKDHRKVSTLLDEAKDESNASVREEIINAIKRELLVHAETEEATFYEALAHVPHMKKMIAEAEEEHEQIKFYLNKLSSLSAHSQDWEELLEELRQAVTHHVSEEENEVFPQARKILSPIQAEQLARAMDTMKQAATHEITV